MTFRIFVPIETLININLSLNLFTSTTFSIPFFRNQHPNASQPILTHTSPPKELVPFTLLPKRFDTLPFPLCFLKTTKIQPPSACHIGQLPISTRHRPTFHEPTLNWQPRGLSDILGSSYTRLGDGVAAKAIRRCNTTPARSTASPGSPL